MKDNKVQWVWRIGDEPLADWVRAEQKKRGLKSEGQAARQLLLEYFLAVNKTG